MEHDDELSREQFEIAKTILNPKGFYEVGFWLFMKNRIVYDLSAADLTQIELIEKDGLFIKEISEAFGEGECFNCSNKLVKTEDPYSWDVKGFCSPLCCAHYHATSEDTTRYADDDISGETRRIVENAFVELFFSK